MQNLLLYLVATVMFIAILLQLIRIFNYKNRKEKPQQASMVNTIDNDKNNPVEVFTGSIFECELVQSLLENAEINAFEYYGESGSMAAGMAPGDPPNRVMVSSEDSEKAKQVVDQFYESMKKEEPMDSTEV